MNTEKKPPSDREKKNGGGQQGGKPQFRNKKKFNRPQNRKKVPYNRKQKPEIYLDALNDAEKFEEDIILTENEYEAIETENVSVKKRVEIIKSKSDNNNEVFSDFEYSKVEITSSDDTDNTSPNIHVAGVRFKETGKVYYFDRGKLPLTDGSFVIVETARGQEYGEVIFADREVPESSIVPPLRQIIRMADSEDRIHNEENGRREKEAFDICLEKINAHGLDMKLVDVQYTFDNSKLIFYFTSSGRVDFRELVKDLASVFKTRIELRQIGIRDEAKILGGLGACGRALCCSTFLSDFAQVSIKMAKEQNLSLNSGKISGCCGRLMCCLQYEYKTYAEETAKTPPVDATVKTPDGIGIVTEINPLAGIVKVKLNEHPDVIPKSYHRDSVTIISKPKDTEEKILNSEEF